MTRRLTPLLLGLVAYSYVGYPALVVGLSRLPGFRRVPPTGTSELPRTVSVVVAALDEENVIEQKIANLLELDYPAELLEIVVVADGSVDATAERAMRAGGQRVVVLADGVRQGKAAAMARGVTRSRGDIIVFTDANNTCAPDALRVLVTPFDDPDVGAVSGAKTVAGSSTASAGERLYWAYESVIKEAESRLGSCPAAIGELMAVRRELMPDFPPGLVNDDFFVAMQIAASGHRMAYAPGAVSIEPPATSERDEIVRRRRMAAGRWQAVSMGRRLLPWRRPMFAWQVVSHKYLRLALPFVMAGAVASSAVDAVRGNGRLTRSILAAHVGFYALAAAGPHTPGPRPLRQAAAAARYVVSSNAAVALGLRDFLVNRDRLHLWQRAPRTAAREEHA